MTYEEAQIAIDDERRKDEVASSLRILNMLAKKLKKKRIDNGALVLASPEIRFQVCEHPIYITKLYNKFIRSFSQITICYIKNISF